MAATQRVLWTSSVTQSQASVSASMELWVDSALSASMASGASPVVSPVSVTATQTSVTPTLGNVETVGTTRQDTYVNGEKLCLIAYICFITWLNITISLILSCVEGFFGNPVLSSGEHCRPCPCPGNPSSGHFNAHSCQSDQTSNQIICNCRQGYTGESQFKSLLYCWLCTDISN